jgi:hypothetical protein
MTEMTIETKPLSVPKPSYREVASLAWMFYLDGDREDGHEVENWLCAEYMLRQKQLIQLQISAIHGRKFGNIPGRWAS